MSAIAVKIATVNNQLNKENSMKYRIICDKPSRLRIRFGKYIITKEQSYGLSELLLSLSGVINAQANEINGSVLIVYENKSTREIILKKLSSLKLSEIKEGVPSDEERSAVLESTLKKKIVKHFMFHLARHLFVPVLPHRIYTISRSIPYIIGGLKSLANKKINVEVLDGTAIGASLLSKNNKTASSTMFLLGLSDLLLEYSNIRAKHALAQSLTINVDKVWLVKNGTEVEVHHSDVTVGDVIRIRKGSLIPIDGTIVKGDALINEATMTGEPISVHKTIDGTVFAGTVIEDGEVDIEVMSLQNNSRIAKIIDLIDTGEKEKALMQGRAERLADDIVPVSFGLFLATLVLTGSVTRALSVLMVDFSCAIKLTTPITIISALKESVNHDVLVKGGKYLEVLSKVDTVVFDKTGTLTNAVPKVSKIIPVKENYTENEVLKVAACLEEHFPHSVAASIVKEAKARGIHHPEQHGKVEYIVAHGIASIYEEKHSVIGSRHFVFEDEKVPYPADKDEWITSEIGSDSAVYLAVDNELIGVICINDPPRNDAKFTIDMLRKDGIKDIIMITGDGESNAKYTSQILGITKYYASVLPDGKASIIEKLKAEGRVILMVGDGINDTPALSIADVSLTLNGSSDIAREVADVSVLSHELTKIVEIRKLSKKLIKKISLQYGIIVSFNTALIILGIMGVIGAGASAWLHNASTIGLTLTSAKTMMKKEDSIKYLDDNKFKK